MQDGSPPRDEKVEKIVAAARQSFLEHGYAATSMDAVAQIARASKTTLYTRFPSKEALFAATIAAECEAFGLPLRPGELAGLPVDEALRRIGQRFLDLILSPQALRMEQVILGEAPRFPEIARSYEQEGPEKVLAAVGAFFADAVERGEIEAPDPRFAAEQFLAALKGRCQIDVMLRQRPPVAGAEREAYVEKCVALFLNGVRKRG
jgi:TetR/AcrR family transcriptional regulator, mexJK operon transcriptional repressor